MQQRDVDSLIDGADEPEPWPRKLPDLGVSRGDIAAHREMLAVDAVRAQRDVRLAFSAHFVCTGPLQNTTFATRSIAFSRWTHWRGAPSNAASSSKQS